MAGIFLNKLYLNYLLSVILCDVSKEETVHIIRTTVEETIQQCKTPFHQRYTSIPIHVNGLKYSLNLNNVNSDEEMTNANPIDTSIYYNYMPEHVL